MVIIDCCYIQLGGRDSIALPPLFSLPGGTVDEAVYHLCRLSLWVLDGSSATLVSALQRQLAGAAELFLADEPVVDVLLPMVALMVGRQARDCLRDATDCRPGAACFKLKA